MTVGELRAALEGLDENREIHVCDNTFWQNTDKFEIEKGTNKLMIVLPDDSLVG